VIAQDIMLSDSSRVLDGLSLMLKAVIGDHDLIFNYVHLSTALLLVAIAKRAPDHAEWFPRGKWATIQNIEGRIDQSLNEIAWQEES
jgi:hypothetical protein